MISRSGGAPDGRTSAGGELTCQNGCHNTFALNSGPGETSISSNIPETGYISGETYQITLKITQSDRMRFGFGALPFSTMANDGIGMVTITDATRTKVNNAGNKQYITHTSDGIDQAADSALWTFDWTAPDIGAGDVSFYAAMIAANNGDGNKEDYVYTDTLTVPESLTNAIGQLTNLAHVKVYPSHVTNMAIVDLAVEQTIDFGLQVLDQNGRQVYHLTRYLSPGSQKLQINTSSWASGVYYVHIRSNRSQGVEKIIKL